MTTIHNHDAPTTTSYCASTCWPQDGEHGVFGQKHWLWHQIYLDNRRLIEASIGGDSRLVGRSMDDVSFKTELNAIPVALHRASAEKSTSVPLEAGDSILLLSTDDFITKYSRDSAFSLVQLVSSFKQTRHRWAPIIATCCAISFIIIGSTVKDAAGKDISLLIPVLCALIVMAISGCASQTELRCVHAQFCFLPPCSHTYWQGLQVRRKARPHDHDCGGIRNFRGAHHHGRRENGCLGKDSCVL